MKKYTLWVGGIEVNDYYLNLKEVRELENFYLNEGYIDVEIEVIK